MTVKTKRRARACHTGHNDRGRVWLRPGEHTGRTAQQTQTRSHDPTGCVTSLRCSKLRQKRPAARPRVLHFQSHHSHELAPRQKECQRPSSPRAKLIQPVVQQRGVRHTATNGTKRRRWRRQWQWRRSLSMTHTGRVRRGGRSNNTLCPRDSNVPEGVVVVVYSHSAHNIGATHTRVTLQQARTKGVVAVPGWSGGVEEVALVARRRKVPREKELELVGGGVEHNSTAHTHTTKNDDTAWWWWSGASQNEPERVLAAVLYRRRRPRRSNRRCFPRHMVPETNWRAGKETHDTDTNTPHRRGRRKTHTTEMTMAQQQQHRDTHGTLRSG